MRTKHNGGGPFDPPSGQVTMETPDGVTKTFGSGDVRNSLTNSDFAYGGPDGRGFGAFREEDDSTPSMLGGPLGSGGTGKFKIG